MRVLAGLIPALAALAQVNAQGADLNMDQVPEDHRDLASIPVTTTEPVVPRMLASGKANWESMSSEKSEEFSRLAQASSTSAEVTTTSKKGGKKTTTTTTTTKKKGKKTTTTTTTTTKKKKPAATKKAQAKKNQRRQAVSSKTSSTATTTTASNGVNNPGSNTGCTKNFQSIMNTYTPTPNTPAQFVQDTSLINTAASKWLPPAGYWTSFIGLMAQTELTRTGKYIMYYQVPSYDPALCAVACDPRDECLGFNMYVSRSPQWEPEYSNATNPKQCTNPVAYAEISCGLYFEWIYAGNTTNAGQWRSNFAVLTLGNNGYNKNIIPPRQTNYTKATGLLGAVNGFNAPEYINYYYWTTQFDDSKCAAQCTAYSNAQRAAAASSKAATYEACNYYNTFNLTYQGTYQGQYCVLYNDTSVLSNGYVTYSQQTYNGVTYTYNLTNSFGTALYGRDPGLTSSPWSAAPTGTAAACANLGTTGSAGFSLTSIDRNNYTVACGYDVFQSNDIGNATATDFYSCFDLCDGFTGCSGFSYVGGSGPGTCYFKDLSTYSKIPTSNSGVSLAWLTSAYSGFNAGGNKVATVSYTTYTTAWTGASTVTTTSFAGLTGYIIIQTPGARATTTSSGSLATTTVYTDSGTASTIGTTTVGTTSKTVTVRVVYPTPSCGSSTGAASYAMYTNSFMGGQNTNSYPAYTPTIYKTITPMASGVANYIAEDNADTAATTIYGRANTDGRQLVVQHTFYLYAGRGTGYYYFQFPYSDDISLLWVGDKATTGWTRANNDLLQFWNGQPQTPVTASFYLAANSWTPVRIQWANGGGQGDLQFSIIDPMGNYIAYSNPLQNSGLLAPQILQNSCTTSQVKQFPGFGKET
ncbi:GLEYA domain-containing protein 2 [Elsinoe fawcettii]|nr:GLEYA domain-containing protein 2 [Elsinoe fawcettii]